MSGAKDQENWITGVNDHHWRSCASASALKSVYLGYGPVFKEQRSYGNDVCRLFGEGTGRI
jgi:hypothetical protein